MIVDGFDIFFFFKQKTAYELRISDWSSDVALPICGVGERAGATSVSVTLKQLIANFMPATPAWPPQSTPRLFVEAPLHAGAAIPLDGAPAHYLLSVMRLKEGDPVKLFDGMSGEWLGIARAVRKRDLVLDVTEKLREREAMPDLWL